MTENKPYIEAMRRLRRSNAAQPHRTGQQKAEARYRKHKGADPE